MPRSLEAALKDCSVRQNLPVSQVINHGVIDDIERLLTTGIPGLSATDDMSLGDPASLVPLLAKGRRALRETPTGDCPFDFRLSEGFPYDHDRVKAGLIDPAIHFHPEYEYFLTPERTLAEFKARRPTTEAVMLCQVTIVCPPSSSTTVR